MQLRNIQNDFYNSLFRERDSGRLGIYQYAHRARLKEAIQEDFPLSLELCSDAKSLLEEFLNKPRSKAFTLNAFGAHWVEFLREHPSASTLLRDLARWEWAEIESSFANENPDQPSPVYQLSEEPPIRAALADSARLERFEVAVHEAQEGASTPPVRESRLLFWHTQGDFHWKELHAEEFAWLSLWRSAKDWSELEQALPAWEPKRLQSLLEELSALGAIRVL